MSPYWTPDLTWVDLILSQQRLAGLRAQTNVRQAHGRRKGEGHGEPREAAGEEAPDRLPRLGRHGALPIRLVHEHRAKVAWKYTTRFVVATLREQPLL